MNQKKNDFDIETKELMFQEEVPEGELYSKVNVDDRIYENNNAGKRVKFLIFLAIFLILVSLFSGLYGFVFLVNQEDVAGVETNIIEYNLNVEHSNSFYGGEIESFSNHNSSSNAFSYDFNVANNNSVELNYSVEIVSPNFGSDNVDLSLINYSLVKNNVEIDSGLLKNIATNGIYSTDILANSKDNYVLKIWSNQSDSNLKYSFKVNVSV